MCEVEVQVGDGAVKPRVVAPKVTDKPKDELDKIVGELSVPTTLEGMVDEVQDTQGLVGAYETERALEARKVNYVVCGYDSCANSARRIALDEKAKYCDMCGHVTRIIASAPESVVTVERIVEKEVPVYAGSVNQVNPTLEEKYRINFEMIYKNSMKNSRLKQEVVINYFLDRLKETRPGAFITSGRWLSGKMNITDMGGEKILEVKRIAGVDNYLYVYFFDGKNHEQIQKICKHINKKTNLDFGVIFKG